MKILHTSDWHIGQTLYGYDRADDHRSVFARIARIAGEEKPDALIISGDVFHTANPSAAAQQLFAESLSTIRLSVPEMTVIVTAGNHDGASRLEAFSPLLRELGVIVNGLPPRIDETADYLARTLVDLGCGYVIPLPFMLPGRYDEAFARALADVVATLDAEKPVVLTGHTTVAGGDFAGHESSGQSTAVGGIEAVAATALGSEAVDYVALGHIHRPQTLRGSQGKVRYSGSPLAVSFDEQYEHTVTLVTLGHRGERPVIAEVALEQERPLITLGGEEGMTWKETEKTLRKLRKNPPPEGSYLRLNVKVGGDEKLPPDADVRAASLAEEAGCRFCLINGIREALTAESTARSMSMQEFRRVTPAELADDYAARLGTPMTPRLRELFAEAVDAARDQESISSL